MAIDDRTLVEPTGRTVALRPGALGGEGLGEILYALRRNPITIIGLSILLVLALAGLFAPLIAPYPPLEKHLIHIGEPPSASFWLGTDAYGQDIFSRLLYAARLDLLIAASAVAVSMVTGSVWGAIAGFVGGPVDETTMRTMDILQAFPRFIFAMGVAYALGPGLTTVIAATSILNVPGYARLMRSMILSLKQRQFAMAAKAVGNSPARILFRHLLPNSLAPIFVVSTLHCGWALLESAGLSFIGLGVPVPTAEWGVMINIGLQDFLRGYWWSYTFPGIAIAIAVLGFNLVGDGLDDILDPRRK
jgi:peptide/nickel transport system permease protein